MLLTLFLPCAAMRVAPPVMQLRNGVPYAPSSVQQQTAAASTAGAAGFSGSSLGSLSFDGWGKPAGRETSGFPPPVARTARPAFTAL